MSTAYGGTKEPSPRTNLYNLYTLTERMVQMTEALDDADAVFTPDELAGMIDAMEGEFNTRIEDAALAVRNANAREAALATEIDRLTTLKKREERLAGAIKGAMLLFMERNKMQKVKGKLATVSVAQNGGKAPLLLSIDPEQLPESFRTTKVEYSANREAIDSAVEMGIPLPEGVQIGERGKHVRIS